MLDLVESRIHLSGVTRLWERVGFERSRRLVAARRDGQLLAMGVFETGERGANLFRLLDGVRLFSLGADGPAACLRLLTEARRWFRARSRDSFVYYMEHDDAQLVREAQLADLGEGVLWCIRRELIPEFLEHVLELSSPRAMSTAQASEATPGEHH